VAEAFLQQQLLLPQQPHPNHPLSAQTHKGCVVNHPQSLVEYATCITGQGIV
jgi:hypothetical protein